VKTNSEKTKTKKENKSPQRSQGYFESLFERSRTTDYETFLYGFFYFFILQDPFIRHYLELKHGTTEKKRATIIDDLDFFNQNYLL